MVPQHAARIKPPRTLDVPFELGRPLGLPDDAAFQSRVLASALELLQRIDRPVRETYLEEASDGDADTQENWACPVSFVKRDDSLEQEVVNEIGLLRPWFDRGESERGYTSVGVCGLELEEIVSFLVTFLDGSTTQEAPSDKYSLSDWLKYAAEDLKAFFNESATSQPGNASAKEVEDWYWNQTGAGKLVRDIKVACTDHSDPMVGIVAAFTLVPHTQL